MNVYWEDEKKTYPGTCLRDDGEWASVTLDEWPDEEEKVKHSCLSYLGDKILKKIDEVTKSFFLSPSPCPKPKMKLFRATRGVSNANFFFA